MEGRPVRHLSVARQFANSVSMKPRHTAACARCGKAGRPRQLDVLLRHDEYERVIVLCDRCVHALRYADASTWKWFRDYCHRS